MARISFVRQGQIGIAGKIHYSDLIVWWDGKVDPLPNSRMVEIQSMRVLLSRQPTDIVIGTGMSSPLVVSSEAALLAKSRNIDIFIDTSEKAVKIFNGLLKDGRRPVAYIRVTI